MAQVQFPVNELTAHDVALGETVEREIRKAAAPFSPKDTVLQCRVLLEQGAVPSAARVRIQFEKPGWVKSFGVSLQSPMEDLRRATDVVLGAAPQPED